jgi:hypothetical protein
MTPPAKFSASHSYSHYIDSSLMVSSFLLPSHHGRYSVAHKRCMASSTYMNLTPHASHEIVARRFVSITDSTSDRMLVVGTHALPKVVLTIASFLRGSQRERMSDVFLRRIFEGIVEIGVQFTAGQRVCLIRPLVRFVRQGQRGRTAGERLCRICGSRFCLVDWQGQGCGPLLGSSMLSVC